MISFIDYIENLYQTLDIYRAIIILNNNLNLNDLINDLKSKNHNPIIINNSFIDYNYRLFIINNPYYLYYFKKNSYNLIIIF